MFQFEHVAGRTLTLLLAVLVCSSCAAHVRTPVQREVLFCQGGNAEASTCRPVDLRELQRALFGR